MKTLNPVIPRLILACVATTFFCLTAAAEESNAVASASTTVDTPVVAQTRAEPSSPKLPYGVDDVLKLSRARISEDVILNFVQSSGTVYDLSPGAIVYLRDEGVSDRVVNAMIDQRKRTTESTVNAPIVAAAPVVAVPPQTVGIPDTSSMVAAPVYDQSPVIEVEATPANSTLYVIPYGPAQAAYYGGYGSPRYYYYGGCYTPVISLGHRWGGHSSVIHFGGRRHR